MRKVKDLSKFNLLTEKDMKEIQTVSEHIGETAGDVAYDSYNDSSGFGSYQDKITCLKRQGVRDVPGALADQLFNDAGFVGDIASDRIFEALGYKRAGDKKVWNQAVDYFTEHCLYHNISGLNKRMKS